MNRQVHMKYSATLFAAILTTMGLDKAHAAIYSIMIARSNQQVDEWTADRATIDCPATQVDLDGVDILVAGAMIKSGNKYPVMSRGHRFHFDPSQGWPILAPLLDHLRKCVRDGVLCDDATLMAIGVALHNVWDTSGPHAEYDGWPCRLNHLLSVKRMAERGDRLPLWARLFGKKIGWGHSSDVDADNIEHNRAAMVKSARMVWRAVTGNPAPTSGGDQMPPCLRVLLDAVNDADLAAMCDRLFFFLTGVELPAYVMFSGGELATWKGVVA